MRHNEVCMLRGGQFGFHPPALLFDVKPQTQTVLEIPSYSFTEATRDQNTAKIGLKNLQVGNY